MPYVNSSEKYKRRLRRSPGRRRLAFGALVVFLAIALAIALRPRTHATPMHVTGNAPVRVAAVRRSAAPHWGDAARVELQAALRSALAGGTSGASAWSCVVLAQDGSVLYDDRGDAAVTPASVEKLIVTDAAIAKLGPAFRYDTLFAATHAPAGGTLDGDLWVAGSGDPSLRAGDLAGGVRALANSGIQSIHGRVLVDASALAGDEINPLWNADDSNEDFMAATSGISIDEDTVEFDVTGTQPGAPAYVRINPQSRAVTLFRQHYDGRRRRRHRRRDANAERVSSLRQHSAGS